MLSEVLERLRSGFEAGAFGYGYRADGAAEAAALGALALHAHGAPEAEVRRPLDWLSDRQRADGGVPVTALLTTPCWPTALTLWAWSRAGDERDRAARERAVGWLLAHRGDPVPLTPLLGHDVTLLGWTWVDDTHSWVEPTAYALIGLRAASRSAHEHFREGVRLLLDRCLPEGGWNYGNTRVMRNVLRPFPATTGIALVALAGEPRSPQVDASLRYLRSVAPTLTSPVSLAWSLLGLHAWGEADAGLEWLEACAAHPGRRRPDPVHDALLLLAAAALASEDEPPEVPADE